MEDPERGFYAVQFHPEVGHTPRGTDMLKNFLSDACHAPATWTALAVIDEQVELIRAQVGDARVICGLSGGVDSAVAALLVYRAIGDQLTCVFVDHGLMRAGRGRAGRRDVRRTTSRCRSSTCEAAERFLAQLAGVTDPETKRKRIGETFIRVFEEESRQLRGRALPRPGHALLRRHRVGLEDRGQDQVAPQRRRPARRTWTSSCASRCAGSSRTRSGASARSSGCPTRSSGASRSRAPASRSASSARSPRSGSRSCATPTP